MKFIEIARADKNDKKSESGNFVQVLCIRYPITFRKKLMPMSMLFDLGSKVNAIHPTFAKELGLSIRHTNVGAPKVDGTTLDTYRMVVIAFSLTDKANQTRFFEETFLVANVSPKIVHGIPFLTLSGADIDFLGWKLWWRTYTIMKALSTTRRIELVCMKKFAATALDLESKTFIVYVTSLSSIILPSSFPLKFDVHPSCRPQISGLIGKKALTKVFTKYLDFADIFLPDLASKLLEHIKINNHTIKLIDVQQPSYRPIYRIEPVELEMPKAYIKTNLANGFIRPSKSPVGALILFNRKSNGFFRLCINY